MLVTSAYLQHIRVGMQEEISAESPDVVPTSSFSVSIQLQIQRETRCLILIWPMQNYAEIRKITETLANGYSSESAQQELSNKYQHDGL